VTDALAKVADAISEFVRVEYCLGCMATPSDCSVSRCPVHELRHHDARGLARAVLEAAGVDELVALVREFGEWVQAERDACPDQWVLDAPACDERCPRWAGCCKLPKLTERIKAALARAGKEA